MTESSTLEQRLEAVEAELNQLKEQVRHREPRPVPGWLDRLIGSQADEPAFDEVVAFGKAFRAGQLPEADQ